jgi:hypothetical protein
LPKKGDCHDLVTNIWSYVMARTFRRKRERHEYYWVLHDWKSRLPYGHWVQLDPRSKAGRKAIAHFHSDKAVTMRGSAPRWYRKAFDHRIRTANDRMLRRWLDEPEFDPVFRAWHNHDANWSWW